MKTPVKTVLLFVLLAALATTGSTAATLSLQHCIEEATLHSPQLSAYRHKVAADRQNIVKRRGTTLPYLSSTLQAYELNGSPASAWAPVGLFSATESTSQVPTSHNPNAHWAPVSVEQVGVSYPLYYEGSILGLNDAPAVATARAEMTEDQLTAMIEEQKVILDVAQSFLNAISYRDQLAINDKLVELYEQDLEITRAQVALGMILPQQIEIVAEELAAARRAAEAARLNAHDYTFQVAKFMGLRDDQTIELDPTKPQLPKLPDLATLLKQVMPLHPALKVQEAKVEVAHQQLRVDSASRLPTARLNTDFASSQDLDYYNGSSVHRRGTQFESYITVDIPLWDFGQRQAATRESEENAAYQKDLKQQLDLTIRNSIAEAYGKIETDAQNVADKRSKYVTAEKAALLASAQYAQGLIDQLALISAQLAELSAAVDLEVATLAERLEFADLQNLLGGMFRWTM